MTETSNIKSIFKKFDQIDPTTDASWKYLIQLFKKCNIQNKSNDLNLLNDAKFEKCRLGMGLTFIANFENRTRKVDLRHVENVSKFLSNHMTVMKPTRIEWAASLKQSAKSWGGAKFIENQIGVTDEQVVTVLENWHYVFTLCGLDIKSSSSVLKIYLALSEKILGAKLGSIAVILKAMDVWIYFTWVMRSTLNEEKYKSLVLQPTNIQTEDEQFYMKRIYVLWAMGRGLASQNLLLGENFGISIGQALKWCLDPEGDYRPPPTAYQAAAEIICHLCVLPSDIPFRSDEIPPLETMLTNEQFAKIAPSVVTELIRFLLICENVSGDHINASTVLHTLTCFLIAISKCSIECLPSLSRLAEFLAQQANGRQAASIIREILNRVPAKLLQQRFQSDDAKEGLTSVARRLLKVIMLGNGTYFEEAKKLIIVLLNSEDHLAAIDQVSQSLRDDATRPGSNNAQVIKLWNFAAARFGQKIAQGLEVSNSPTESDLSSIYDFFHIPILLKSFKTPKSTNDLISENTVKKFKHEWSSLYAIVKSNASLLVDFKYDDLVSSLANNLLNEGLENMGPALTLELLNLIICNKGDTSPSFLDESTLKDDDLSKHHSLCTTILKTVTEHPDFNEFKSEPVEAGLNIISKLLTDGHLAAYQDFSQLLPLFAKHALDNRKNPSWQFCTDLIVQVLDLIAKSSSPAVDLFGSCEELFILMLSDVSSRRMSYACAQTWESKFHAYDEQLPISDAFWTLVKPFYIEGKWPIPSSRSDGTIQPKGNLKDRSNIRTSPLREKNSTIKSNRKSATPQRFNRQLAALSGGTPKRGSTPKSARKKVLCSTFQNKDDDTGDFVTINSPISFSGRRLTDHQKEKMREKKSEEHVGTALYSAVDDSQGSRSMSQFLQSDTQTTSSEPKDNTIISRPRVISGDSFAGEVDETAIDFSDLDSSKFNAHSTFVVPGTPSLSSTIAPGNETTAIITAGIACDGSILDSTSGSLDESSINASEAVENVTIDKTANMTAGIGCGGSMMDTSDGIDDSTINESEVENVPVENEPVENVTINKTGNMTAGIGCQQSLSESVYKDASTLDDTGNEPEEVEKTGNMTTGVGCGNSVNQSKYEENSEDESISFSQPTINKTENESELMKTATPGSKSKLPAPILTRDESEFLRSTADEESTEAESTNVSKEKICETILEISSGEEEADEEETSKLTSTEEDVFHDAGSNEGSDLTAGSLSPDPVVNLCDVEETPLKKLQNKSVIMVDLTDETAQLPTPEPIGKFERSKSEVDSTDLNTSTSSLPVLSDNDEDLDEDEESIHEPFKDSFNKINAEDFEPRRLNFDMNTQEFEPESKIKKPESMPTDITQSPSILKRKRSMELQNAENKLRRVSFSDQFADNKSKSFNRARPRITSRTLGLSSPAANRLSRSERMLQMANGTVNSPLQTPGDLKPINGQKSNNFRELFANAWNELKSLSISPDDRLWAIQKITTDFEKN